MDFSTKLEDQEINICIEDGFVRACKCATIYWSVSNEMREYGIHNTIVSITKIDLTYKVGDEWNNEDVFKTFDSDIEYEINMGDWKHLYPRSIHLTGDAKKDGIIINF